MNDKQNDTAVTYKREPTNTDNVTRWTAIIALCGIGAEALTMAWLWPLTILCVIAIYALARPPQ